MFELLSKLPPPTYKLRDIPEDLQGRKEALEANYALRLEYINSILLELFPDVADIVKGQLDQGNFFQVWRQILRNPQDRAYLEAAKQRAVAYEQRPAEFVELDLTDLDFIESQQSIQRYKATNKSIEKEVTSDSFRSLSNTERSIKLREMFKKRDEEAHPLVFILSLNVNDLPSSEIRKLDALHAVGRHDEAKVFAKELVSSFKRKAIAEYRQSVANKVSFNKTEFRSFS